MSSVLLGAQFFLFAAVLFVLFGSVIAALAKLVMQRWLMTLHSASRYRVLFALALLPVVLGVLLLVVACVPAVLSLLSPLRDHCLAHEDVHAHLCFVHLPKLVHVNTWLLVAVSAAAVVGLLSLIHI